MSADKRFDGLTVLITGAAGGFGRRAARLFAEEGANLVLSDFGKNITRDAAEGLINDGYNVAHLGGDIAKEETAEKLTKLAIDTFGRLDVAINNAGIGHTPAKTAEVDSVEAQRTINVDLMGVFYGMKHQIPVMEKQFHESGKTSSILNVASIAGLVGAPTMSIYVAAKHGVVGLTKTAALEYARRGIRVNALCPAFARTPMVEDDLLGGAEDKEQAEGHLTRGVPMRRLAEASEITQAMLWACDPANSFMTGHALAIDGGLTAM